MKGLTTAQRKKRFAAAINKWKSRNSSKRVKKVRVNVKRSTKKSAHKKIKVVSMGKKRSSSKASIPPAASLFVLFYFLNETGLLQVLLNSWGAGKNVITEIQTWIQSVELGDFIDGAIPVGVLWAWKKFVGARGPNLIGNWRLW